MLRALAAAVALSAAASVAFAGSIQSSVDTDTLSAKRQTTLGLYVTSVEAHRALEADPSIIFVDVRTTAEFTFVGHPSSIDGNVPYRFHTREYSADRKGYKMEDNPGFVTEVLALVARDGKDLSDPVFVICRSGSRSRGAADVLAEAGFTNVYNVVDGFEGGKDKATGHRTIEGWRYANLPWTYSAPVGVAKSW